MDSIAVFLDAVGGVTCCHVAAQHTEHREPDASILLASGSFRMREALGIDAGYLAVLVEGC